MKSRVILMCIALVAVVAVASWLRLSTDAPPADADDASSSAVTPASGAKPGTAQPGQPSVLATRGARTPSGAAGAANTGRFESVETGLVVDANGKLVKDARTRDELERLLDGDPTQLESSKRELMDNLPPAAAEEALDLLERFTNYRAAMEQAMPAQYEALTEEDALVMLGTMHDMRVAYFGQELTEAFFGAEEAIGKDTAEQILQAR